MIAFHPHHFYVAFWIGELADVGEKLPVLFGEAPKVEVAEDVTQQDQPLESPRAKKVQRFPGPAHIGAQVQVGDDHGVPVARALHALYL